MSPKHFILLDPLEKLVVEKDSTVMFALTLQKRGDEVYFIFADDFFWDNSQKPAVLAYTFSGALEKNGVAVKHCAVHEANRQTVNSGDYLHMRLDPPFDCRYLRLLWQLRPLEKSGVRVTNSALGILSDNEKTLAYEKFPQALPSLVSSSPRALEEFLASSATQKASHLIIKPLDLFQGLGVQKVEASHPEEVKMAFLEAVKNQGGAVVVQPFYQGIMDGEIRALYFRGQELGSILKKPKEGQFLANVAQGASYAPYDLLPQQRSLCEQVCHELAARGVSWVAFDLLGDYLSEVNITCPGLLVEVSLAHKKNLAQTIAEMMPS